MNVFLLLLVTCLPMSTLHAEEPSLVLTGGKKSEEKLRRFLDRNPFVREKLLDASERQIAFLLESRDLNLRDAVTDESQDALRAQHAQSAHNAALDRIKLLNQMPGLNGLQPSQCTSLNDCPTPELALDVAETESLRGALRTLIRPWMLLQQSRGSTLEIAPVSKTGDAIVTLKLNDVIAPHLVLNVSPRLLGGYKVWFDQPLLLATLYGQERDEVLQRQH